MSKRPFVHSYSAGKAYEQCPQLFLQDRVQRRFPFVQSPEAKRGDEIHNALADGIKHGKPIPAKFKGEDLHLLVEAARNRVGLHLVEQKWALTKSFEPTGYYDDDAYYRYRNDYASITKQKAVIIDWKTGKDKYPDVAQLAEGAVVLMVHYPEVETVVSGLVFTATGKMVPATYTRGDLPMLIDQMAEKYAEIDRAMAEEDYPLQDGPLCPWCPVTDCPNWRPKPVRK